MTFARLKPVVALLLTLAMLPAPVLLAMPAACSSGGCGQLDTPSSADNNCCGRCKSADACQSGSCCAKPETKPSRTAAEQPVERSCCAAKKQSQGAPAKPACDPQLASSRQLSRTNAVGCGVACALSNCGCQTSSPMPATPGNSDSRISIQFKSTFYVAVIPFIVEPALSTRAFESINHAFAARPGGAELRILLCSWTV